MTCQLIEARAAAVQFEGWARYLLDNPDDVHIRAHVERLRFDLIVALVKLGPVTMDSADKKMTDG